jgi:hypothetical protein
MIILTCVLWWLIGVAGFIFWWTKDDDLYFNTLLLGFFVGLSGPLTWLIGFFIHASTSKIIIIKRRN